MDQFKAKELTNLANDCTIGTDHSVSIGTKLEIDDRNESVIEYLVQVIDYEIRTSRTQSFIV